MWSEPGTLMPAHLSLRDAEETPVHGLGAPLAERSITGGMFKAVNPARPVSPTNSRLFSLPGQKKIKIQVMGR
jgi:hypothetical protein